MLGSLLTSLRLSDPDFDSRLTNPLADHGFKHATQDTRWSNALADQSYRPLPLNMPLSKLAMPL